MTLLIWEMQQLRRSRSGTCPQSTQQCLKFGRPLVRPMSILVGHLLGQYLVHSGRLMHFIEQLEGL